MPIPPVTSTSEAISSDFMMRILSLVAFLVVGLMAPSFFVLYLCVIGVLLVGGLGANSHSRFTRFFFISYLAIGLLEISDYRGLLSRQSMEAFLWLAAMISVIGITVDAVRTPRKPLGRRLVFLTDTARTVMILHIGLVYSALLYVVVAHGNILIDQSLRFELPTVLKYLINSSVVVPIIYFACRNTRWTPSAFLLFLVVPIVPAMVAGSRAIVVVAAASFVCHHVQAGFDGGVRWQQRTQAWRRRRTPIAAISGAGIISYAAITVFFYVRRMNSSVLVPANQLIRDYFYIAHPSIYLILPLYLGLRETVALTGRIMDVGLSNDSNVPIVLQDLVTMLPGEQISAGRALAQNFGSVGDGGLTPGLLGALWIDFGAGSYAIIGVLLIALGVLYKKARWSDYMSIYYSISLVQFFHLFHRGFFKPEYVLTYFIAMFYLEFARRRVTAT